MTFFRNKLTVAVILLSVTFLLMIGYSVKREKGSFIENGAGLTLNTVQGVVYRFDNRVSGFFSFLMNFSEVKKENEALKARNNELEEKALEYDSVASENERLRQALDFKNRNSHYEQVACHIVSRTGSSVFDGYAIDRGTKSGIAKGMIVVSAEGLVGQITEAYSDWSKVQTLANENIAVAAMVENTKENTGVIKGYKDVNKRFLAKIYHLPQASNIKKGDVILTSGEGFLYPKGIRIGYVLDVEEDSGKIEKNAIVQPYVDFNKLEEVIVIVSKDKENIKYDGDEIK